MKKRHRPNCFPVSFAKFSRKFLQNTPKCLFLLVQDEFGKKYLYMYRNVNTEADSINALKIMYVLYATYTLIDR